MRKIFLLLVLFAFPIFAHAQTTDNTYCAASAAGPWAPCAGTGGSSTNPSIVTGAAAASTPISGTITTAGTFQSATAANTSRKGCFIQNTSSFVEYIYLGATASATLTNSAQVQPGGTFTCAAPFGVVADDNVAITAATGGSGATYVGWIQ